MWLGYQGLTKNMTSSASKFLIMAGGTGGHILPALAVAKALQAQGAEIDWLGTARGLEHQLVSPTGIPLHLISMQGVRGKGIAGLLLAPFRLLRATYQACNIIRKLSPTAVLGFGGFVTAPGGLAAWLLRKPLILHEQNAVAGMSNCLLAHLATQVFQAFPHTFPEKFHAITCGNPVREEIFSLISPLPPGERVRVRGVLNILILGGSQGATFLNQTIPETLALLPPEQRPEIWHSAGKNAQEKTQALYQQLNIPAKVDAFIHDMPAAYTWADLVICRAGALTVSELAAAGVASILIPFPAAVDDHQTKNAMWLVNAGAAILMPQREFDPQKLVALLLEFTGDKTKIVQMANAARSVAILDATQKIVNFVLSQGEKF